MTAPSQPDLKELPTDISTDGPHEIDDHRRWLARQLLDSKLSDKEAFSIVINSPAVKPASPATGGGVEEIAGRLIAEVCDVFDLEADESISSQSNFGSDDTVRGILRKRFSRVLSRNEGAAEGDCVPPCVWVRYEGEPERGRLYLTAPNDDVMTLGVFVAHRIPADTKWIMQVAPPSKLAAAPASPADGGGGVWGLLSRSREHLWALADLAGRRDRLAKYWPLMDEIEAALASRPAVEGKLVEALRPFAEYAEIQSAEDAQAGVEREDTATLFPGFEWGAFKQARAALKAHGGEE